MRIFTQRLLLTSLAFTLTASAQTSCDLPASLPLKQPSKVLHYSTRNNDFDKIDLYLPEAVTNPPLILIVHGGGWVNDAGEPGFQNDAMYLNHEGYAVANVKYRLATPADPTSYFPSAVQDLRCAIRYLRTNQTTLGFHAEKIGAIGGSAGGNLVAMLGVLPASFQSNTNVIPFTDAPSSCLADTPGKPHPASDVQAVAAYFPPSNVTDPKGVFNEGKGGGGWNRYLGLPATTIILNNPAVEHATPEFYIGKPKVKATLPSFLVVNGSADALVPPIQSVDLTNALNAVRPHIARHDLLEGLPHGFAAFDVKNPKIRTAACDVVALFHTNIPTR